MVAQDPKANERYKEVVPLVVHRIGQDLLAIRDACANSKEEGRLLAFNPLVAIFNAISSVLAHHV